MFAPPAGPGRAVPLRFSGAGTGQPKTADQGEDLDPLILKLLAVGLTDRAVARQLNLSRRTVQRHVATLMTRRSHPAAGRGAGHPPGLAVTVAVGRAPRARSAHQANASAMRWPAGPCAGSK